MARSCKAGGSFGGAGTSRTGAIAQIIARPLLPCQVLCKAKLAGHFMQEVRQEERPNFGVRCLVSAFEGGDNPTGLLRKAATRRRTPKGREALWTLTPGQRCLLRDCQRFSNKLRLF